MSDTQGLLPPRSRLAAVAIAAAVALAAAATPGAWAAPTPDPDGGDADRIDVLTADRDQVRAELARLDSRYAAQLAAVERAEAEAAAAQEEVRRAEARVAAAELHVEAARRTVVEYAVEAYIRPPAEDALMVLSISEADDASFAANVLQILTEERHRVVGELVEKQEQAARERERARAAERKARDAANDAAVQLVQLDRTRSEQRQLAADLDARLDHALAEAAMLAELDRRASEELAAKELALRESGPASPSTEVLTVREERPPVATPVTTTTAPRAPSPRPTTTRPPAPTPPPPSGVVTWNDVTRVGGIWVHKSIAANVQALLNAASAAGFNLGGGGYRDPQGQIDTRRNNCGPTYYDIYLKPASQCTPPTARPGTSMHEKGLAIDFTSNGSLITSRSDPAFIWLSNNAHRFGLYNLPSEPWHWSTNGH